MTKSSNRSKSTFSPEIEKQVKEIVSRALNFKGEATSVLLKYKPPRVREEANQIIENLFSKFHIIVGQIKKRHDKRSTLDINDEYDVQDLLHTLLTLYFEDIRREEYAPSYAGTSPRMDVLLKREKIVIEAKMTRKGLGKRKVREELIIDKEYYQKHPDCKTLYCLVYDPEERISNPRGFESDVGGKVGDFEAKVFIVPKRV